jgi:hypothetical protein
MKRSNYSTKEEEQSKRPKPCINAAAAAATAAPALSKETLNWFDRFQLFSDEQSRQKIAEKEFCLKNHTETCGGRILCSFCRREYVICRRIACRERTEILRQIASHRQGF